MFSDKGKVADDCLIKKIYYLLFDYIDNTRNKILKTINRRATYILFSRVFMR